MTKRLYRVHKPCRLGERHFKEGELVALSLRKEIEVIATEKSECLSVATGPPITRIPEFHEIGAQLANQCDICMVEDLLVANAKTVAAELRVSKQKVEDWKRLLTRYIV